MALQSATDLAVLKHTERESFTRGKVLDLVVSVVSVSSIKKCLFSERF